MSKNLSDKYIQKTLHVTTDEEIIRKTAEVTGNLIGNKIAHKTARTLPQIAAKNYSQKDERSIEVSLIHVIRKKCNIL